MSTSDLEATARALVADGKGILAADETVPTVTHRMAVQSIESTVDSRRAYREMFFTTAGIGEFLSGVILQDETIQQSSAEGTPLPQVLLKQGIFPGIKVDDGPKPLAGFPNETITEGLDGLRGRLVRYRELGARFAKWRAVFTVSDTLPSTTALIVNAHALARYAALCQEQGVVPIVEPEVLMDGPHDIECCEEVTGRVLHAVFGALFDHGILLEGMLLKPNMVLAGAACVHQASPEKVARLTVRCLRRHVPAAVPGIVFLSGGQGAVGATANLNAINAVDGPRPWTLTFSYGRALQDEALRVWRGKEQNLEVAQRAFRHRAKCDSAAAVGKYTTAMESELG
jgi:fructose-bisphosphate aldolase class I